MTEAELLFTEILNCDRADLYLNGHIALGADKAAFASSVLKRRFRHEPLAYILGKTEFMGLEFKVDRDVLIPRQETEILAETVLRYATKSPNYKVTSVKILDLGTGSGCIAVSLAKFLNNAVIDALDISEAALKTAKENALGNKISQKIRFIKSDLFKCIEPETRSYNIIVSNPPYIPCDEIADLQPEVQFEPRHALDGGKDGLDFYRKIIAQAPGYLKAGGFLIFEVGFGQLESVKKIFQIYGKFEIIEVVRDYSGVDRVLIAQKLCNVRSVMCNAGVMY